MESKQFPVATLQRGRGGERERERREWEGEKEEGAAALINKTIGT